PLEVNRRAAASFGYDSPEHFLREVGSMLDLWADLGERDRAAVILLETGRLDDFPVVMKRRDGSWATLFLSATPLTDDDGNTTGLLVGGVDITARVEAERRLDEAQSHASIGFWTWRIDTETYEPTKAIYQILGIDHIDSPGDMRRLIHRDDLAMFDAEMSGFQHTPGARMDFELRIVTPAGQTRWVIVRGCVDGDGTRISGSVQDITERKLIEERLTELNELKSEFVSVVAHDLRLPLTIASGYAELLEERGADLADDERDDMIQGIRAALDRLNALVTGVLEVTRIEAAATTPELAPFDLAALVLSAAAELRAIEPYPMIQVSIEGDLPDALGERDAVWRVVTNLVTNAVKYSPVGAPIQVDVRRRQEQLLVSVRDRGPGIAPADQGRLFQKFARLSSGDAPRPAGTGLGLYICRSLIEGLGGTIWVESVLGAGSTFHFTVPVAVRTASQLATG
ncbi:MAG: PAS domain-containing sensor histidine kinase, partial [Actinomycetota bacterium]